jgi:hypothetical protein
MTDFWNERYGQNEFVYGEAPNEFFAGRLSKLPPGKILLPCDGEGRNGVYAATLGWDVQAFDTSEAGRTKAMQLAARKGVTIDYKIADAATCEYQEGSLDVVAIIYAHLPPAIRKSFNERAIKWLKPGGRIMVEVFHKRQIGNDTGGPKDIDMLYDESVLMSDFKELTTVLMESPIVELHEGTYHDGKAEVMRFVGVKDH